MVMSMIRSNFWQSLKNSVYRVQSHRIKTKLLSGFEPYVQNCFKLRQKLRHILLSD